MSRSLPASDEAILNILKNLTNTATHTRWEGPNKPFPAALLKTFERYANQHWFDPPSLFSCAASAVDANEFVRRLREHAATMAPV